MGIYWQDVGKHGKPDVDALGYRTSVVISPATTLLLAEEPNWQNVCGNIWPCICNGPMGSSADDALYQTVPNPTAANHNYGNDSYGIHAQRFNYLLHDGHVETLRLEQTVGTGTLGLPKGIWTIQPGD